MILILLLELRNDAKTPAYSTLILVAKISTSFRENEKKYPIRFILIKKKRSRIIGDNI